jgi:hypothetical protein
MSSVFEEILTSSIGFIIAVVILAAIIGGALYGYWVYADHQTLQNYLWPVAEVLPYQGEYFLAIVNTGNEPFYVEQIYLKGGAVLTPSQAGNPGLSWCSVSNTELVHNEWWCGMVNQLPVAVMVCSALDPQVCSVVPVHGWQVVTFSQPNQAAFGLGNGSGLIEVVVNDPLNAGWSVTWSYSGPGPYANTISYSMSKSTSYTWFINPPYVPIQMSFKASITKNPTNYKCQIVPSSVTNTYSAGSVQQFTVNCELLPITVYVYDLYPEPAGWEISWSGAAGGSESGYGMASFTVQPTQNGTVYFNATITNVPSGYSSCTITPTNTTALPGQSVGFVINCYGGPIYMDLVVQSNAPFSVGVYPWQGYPVAWDPVFSGDGSQSVCGMWLCWTLNSNVTLIPGQTYSIGVQPNSAYFSGAPPGSYLQCSINGIPYPVGAWTPFTAPNVSFVESVTVFCTVNTPSPPIGGSGSGGSNYPGNCHVDLNPAYTPITSPGINTVTFTASLSGDCPSNGYWEWFGGNNGYVAQYNFMVNNTWYWTEAGGSIVTNLNCQTSDGLPASGIGYGSSITGSYTLICS